MCVPPQWWWLLQYLLLLVCLLAVRALLRALLGSCLNFNNKQSKFLLWWWRNVKLERGGGSTARPLWLRAAALPRCRPPPAAQKRRQLQPARRRSRSRLRRVYDGAPAVSRPRTSCGGCFNNKNHKSNARVFLVVATAPVLLLYDHVPPRSHYCCLGRLVSGAFRPPLFPTTCCSNFA